MEDDEESIILPPAGSRTKRHHPSAPSHGFEDKQLKLIYIYGIKNPMKRKLVAKAQQVISSYRKLREDLRSTDNNNYE